MIRKTALILSAAALCAASAPAFAGGPSTVNQPVPGSAVAAQATVVSVIARASVGGGGRITLGAGMASFYRAAAGGGFFGAGRGVGGGVGAGAGAGAVVLAPGVVASIGSPTGFVDANGNPVNADGTPAT
ncbi:hypothetical protein DL237_19970 [Pseudooceanicola sediminis]|uniref:Uncharacterized protein n=1 Tax=Pseudooceanicola sediminis TaxID=2211117 RepID=A0A399IV33_9RHOB|nr:hypothetical protein [Pseudooceanicola sediminis]KAA2311372.1 hypothetical protein E0K93_20795 [Puniceibacterium sp. HSS470]RII36921.1 hypothetical protein DL237_19970 [Pseudooceanicola sediminis]|tara:strand:+ start:5632 stop:6021 length:390 start_codon:yes stop_codon:yes gene_type:complete